MKWQFVWDKYGFFIVLSAALLLHIVLWGPVFWHPGSYLFAPGGDGVKNFYTFAYHILHGEGIWFTGMNYPYGDHLLYADSMPLLSVLLSELNGRVLDLGVADVMAFFNVFLFASMIVSAPLIYLLQRAYRIPHGTAALAAISICLLQPQFDRLTGHYSLSLMYFLPLVWLLLIRVVRTDRPWRASLLTALVILLHFFLHPYLGMIACSFILAFYLINGLVMGSPGWRSIHWLVIVFLPIALFQGFMFLTDPLMDGRQPLPWGFMHYQSDGHAVFLPPDKFFRDFLQQFIGYPSFDGEKRAYIGFFSFLGLLLMLVYGVKRWRSGRTLSRFFSTELARFFWASFLVLLFAMGVPFVWNMEFLLDYVTFIRQFRAVGRFAWPFFYTTFVVSMLFYHQQFRLLRMRGLRGLAYTLGAVLFLFMFAEAKSLATDKIRYVKKWGGYGQNYLGTHDQDYNFARVMAEAGQDPQSYQAILPMPFENIGSEEIAYDMEANSLYLMTSAALHTGLPTLGVNMSRSVLARAFDQQRLVSTNPETNPLIGDLPDDRPILVLVSKERPERRNRQEQFYLQEADTVAEHPNAFLLSLPVTVLDDYPDALYAPLRNSGAAFRQKVPGLEQWYWATDSNAIAVYHSFSEARGATPALGEGAAHSRRAQDTLLSRSVDLPPGRYELTLWSHLNTEEAFFGTLTFLVQGRDHQTLQEITFSLQQPDELFRDWIQRRLVFALDRHAHYLLLLTHDDNPKTIDELLIRSETDTIWYPVSPELLNLNGQLIHRVDWPVAEWPLQ